MQQLGGIYESDSKPTTLPVFVVMKEGTRQPYLVTWKAYRKEE